MKKKSYNYQFDFILKKSVKPTYFDSNEFVSFEWILFSRKFLNTCRSIKKMFSWLDPRSSL